MNQQEHLMTVFAEELGEISVEILNYHQNPEAARLIESEWQDLLGTAEKLKEVGIFLHLNTSLFCGPDVGIDNVDAGSICTSCSLVALDLQKQFFKALRFGIDEQRDLPTSNRERISIGWNRLQGVFSSLALLGVDLSSKPELISAKQSKIEKYCRYAIERGTLES